MRCPVQQGDPEIVLNFCTRKLDPDTAAIFRKHVVLCPECRDFVDAQEEIWRELDRLEPCVISPDFDARLYARIEAEEARSWRTRLFGRVPTRQGALALTAVCATVVAALFLRPSAERGTDRERRETVRIEALEPEQIDRTIEDMEMLRQFSTPGQVRAL